MFDVEPEEGETLTELENRCAKKFQDLSEDQKLAFVVKKEDWKTCGKRVKFAMCKILFLKNLTDIKTAQLDKNLVAWVNNPLRFPKSTTNML